MNNLSNNLDYNIQQYTTLTQAQLLNSNPIQQDKQQQDKDHTMNQLQDPNFMNYQSFPLLRMTPPQLHQPTIAKEPTPTCFNSIEQDERVGTPIRITRPPNAYLLFNKEMRKILKEQDPTMKVADISKEVGLRWKTMPQEQKDQYVKQANQIKEEQRALHPNSMYIRRSRAELVKAGHFTKRAPDEIKRKKTKREKNSAIPKHPLSAYMWYLTEVRPETMRNYPGSNVGQISKLCAERWNAMSEEQRTPWKNKAQVDKDRYAREMQIYAIQNDHHLGRGTRQKYRSAALKSTDQRFMEFYQQNNQLSAPTSPSSILHTLNPETLLQHDTNSHTIL